MHSKFAGLQGPHVRYMNHMYRSSRFRSPME